MTIQQILLGGAAAAKVQLFDNTSPGYSDEETFPDDSYCGFQLTNTGNAQYVQGASLVWNSAGYSWLLSGAASDYYVSATMAGSALYSGSTGVWEQLNTTRSWYYWIGGTGSKSGTLTLEISDSPTGNPVLATCDIALSALVSV